MPKKTYRKVLGRSKKICKEDYFRNVLPDKIRLKFGGEVPTKQFIEEKVTEIDNMGAKNVSYQTVQIRLEKILAGKLEKVTPLSMAIEKDLHPDYFKRSA